MTRFATAFVALAFVSGATPVQAAEPAPPPPTWPDAGSPPPSAPAATEPAPAPQPQPAPVPQPVPATQPAPAVVVVQQPPPPQPVVTAPQPAPPVRRGHGLVAAGASLTAVGGASLLIVTGVSALVKTTALENADDDDGRNEMERHLTTARHADNAMEVGFWLGVSSLAIGLPLLITGLVVRSSSRSSARAAVETHGTRLQIRF